MNENRVVNSGGASVRNNMVLRQLNVNRGPLSSDISKSPIPAASAENEQIAGNEDFPIPVAISPHPGVIPFSIDEALKNPRKTTNVYIRGLAPTTTDDILYKIVARFGSVSTAKAMMDNITGLCKGFGFAQFQTEQEAKQCICGLAEYGYQTSFAKVCLDILFWLYVLVV